MGIKSNLLASAYYNFFGATGKDTEAIPPPPPMSASGGTEIIDGSYTYHVYVSDSTFVVTDSPGTIEAIVIGGGGGARGDWPGGGGAGGVAHAESWPMTPGTYPVVIGDGGAASPISSGDGSANKGADTTFNGITGLGGGAGTQDAYQGPLPFSAPNLNGGSGGGNGDEPVGPTTAAGTGTQPTEPTHGGLVTNYGNPGFAPAGGNTWPATTQNNGGGGGAGGGGTDGLTTGPTGGAGQPFTNFPGPLIAPAIPGVPNWAINVGPTGLYGGGGGASGDGSGGGGDPGPGGGGRGGPSGFAGLNYTGGGGGGQNGNSPGGYDGGKGVVIIRRLT